jgi:formate-dependent nitrite reductase membrane component NrfD
MSVGAWVLLIFSVFSFVSFLEALGVIGTALRGAGGALFVAVGGFFGLFLAGYTGILLSVSNQVMWSDTWALGGLFLASGLSVATAAIELLARLRPTPVTGENKLWRADRFFIVLELARSAGGSSIRGGWCCGSSCWPAPWCRWPSASARPAATPAPSSRACSC